MVTFDFLGWGESDKPAGYPYTAHNQTGDLDTVITQLGLDEVVLVAHDASGPPAIDWALAHPARVAALVLLNPYYGWMPALHAPQAITLYSTPLLRNLARPLMRRFDGLNRRLYFWQVGRFIRDQAVRRDLLPQYYARVPRRAPGVLAAQRRPAAHADLPGPAHRPAAHLRPTRADRVRRRRSLPQHPRRPPVRPTVPERAARADRRCPPLRPGRRTKGSRRSHPHRGSPRPVERQQKHSRTEHPTLITTGAVTVATPPATGFGARPSPRGDGAAASPAKRITRELGRC